MKKRLLYTVIFSLVICGCKNYTARNDKIKIENKLNQNIIAILGYNYPDLNLNFINKQAIMANSRFEIAAGEIKEIDSLGLCQKDKWDKHINHNILMLFIFDKAKFAGTDKLEDALVERSYFSYTQLMETKGIIIVNN